MEMNFFGVSFTLNGEWVHAYLYHAAISDTCKAQKILQAQCVINFPQSNLLTNILYS